MDKQKIIDKAYAPEQFRKDSAEILERLATHLEHTGQKRNLVYDWVNPSQATEELNSIPDKDLNALLDYIFKNSIRLHHPHFVGHQISPTVPSIATFGMLVDLLNNGMGVFEMGSAGTLAEQFVVSLLAKRMGLPETAGGFMTSGGSLANLTAILSARAKAEPDAWQGGNKRPMALMVSEAAHYCVDRAVRIMGWGEQGIIRVPVDDQYQMQTGRLDKLRQKAESDGIRVVCCIGSACTTSTGAYDDLNLIADFCEKHSIWFHVDGAHGAAVTFSEKYRGLIDGIERADSVTIDFHKLLLAPALTSALVFREHKDSFRTFSQQADYLWSEDGSGSDDEIPVSIDLAKRTFECTKQMMSVKVFATLKLYGEELFAANVETLFDLASEFGSLVEQHSCFELATEVQSNIVCFRFIGDPRLSSKELTPFNEQIRDKVVRAGQFYIVQTKLDGETWLRTTITNPLTTAKDLEALLDHIKNVADQESRASNAEREEESKAN